MLNIIDELHMSVMKKGPICVGLDPRESMLPDYIKNKEATMGEKLFEFNQHIIDATMENASSYKLQIACYEAFGLDGLKAYSDTVKYLRQKKIITIGDIKRGDISSTAEMYAKGHFEGDFEVDFITLNPYMGEDAISPYYKYLKTGRKGAFVLIRTSNKSSKDIQELKCDGEEVFYKTAQLVEKWGEDFVGKSGFSSLGSVVGLTYPEEFKKIKAQHPGIFHLIPGYGAQGGTGKDAAEILGKEMCGVINASRSIIGAHKGINETESFAECAGEAALKMKEDILKWL